MSSHTPTHDTRASTLSRPRTDLIPGSEMLKNAAGVGGGRMKWPFTCVATSATELLAFNMADLERAAKNIDRVINSEMDKIMMAITKAAPIVAAAAASAKLSQELRACAERSHVIWMGR